MVSTPLTRIIVAVASTAASIIVAKYLEKYLNEKPLGQRMDEWKEVVDGVRLKATDAVVNTLDDVKKYVKKDVPPAA